jgi:hypothetical protein
MVSDSMSAELSVPAKMFPPFPEVVVPPEKVLLSIVTELLTASESMARLPPSYAAVLLTKFDSDIVVEK